MEPKNQKKLEKMQRKIRSGDMLMLIKTVVHAGPNSIPIVPNTICIGLTLQNITGTNIWDWEKFGEVNFGHFHIDGGGADVEKAGEPVN